MSSDKPQGVTGTVAGWIKALVTSVIGLASGAFLMYLTPLVNNAIKPAKPVANFAAKVGSLTVEFNNRSTGATQGWWDFGDGSALEPFDPKSETVKHVYTRPGTYSVKLSLQNLIGDENERIAAVTIDAETVAKPEIETFKLIPLSADDRAPATYRLVSKVKNATSAILCAGDNRPMEILNDAATQERYLTFDEMGVYTVRFAAVNNKHLVEKTETVYVSPGDSREPMAKLHVVYEAVRVERLPPRDWRVFCAWPADTQDNVVSFRKERLAEAGCTIVSAELISKEDKTGMARKVNLEIAPDKSKLIVTGELSKSNGVLAPKAGPQGWLAHVRVLLERRSPVQTFDRGEVVMAVNMNSPIKIPMQPLGEGYEIVRKQVNLELWDGTRKVWEGSKGVTNAKVTLRNQACLLTALPQADSVVLQLSAGTLGTVTLPSAPAPVGPLIRPAGFERVPGLPKRP